jgi:hypothetical protein
MSDEINKNPVPRVVRGTGYYTPMDIAPGESVAAPTEPAPTMVGEMVGHPTPMNITPPASTPQPAPDPQQTSDGSGNAKAE